MEGAQWKSDVNVTRIQGGTDTRKGTEAVLEETLSENFSKMRKNFKPQVQNIS